MNVRFNRKNIKNVRFKTPMPRSDLCDQGDAYIFVKETIDLSDAENVNIILKDVAFKNNAPNRSCMTKINSILIDVAK